MSKKLCCNHAGWSDWQLLSGDWSPSAAVLAETLDGGQAFGWWHGPEDCWTGRWLDQVAQLRQRSDGRLEWRAPDERQVATAAALPRYLALDTDWAALTDALPWRSDPHLAECLRCFPGLRLLRQPFGETLLGFLCSATKQIVQIKQMLASLAERHGVPLAVTGRARTPFRAATASACVADAAAKGLAALPLHRLPTWAELATIPEAELRQCQLGFRARFIGETARFLAAHPGWLDETEHLPYAAAKARLVMLPGVGEKVADCVLLFGAGRLEAFPVDVWILKALARRYGLDGWKPAQVAQFGRAHFGPLAGLAQQYLFSWERAHRDGPATPRRPSQHVTY
ncbi:MAG: DNA-3-methyladenine glycosylase family protein [Opitutales bacterium]